MKRHSLSPDEREEKLIEATRRLVAGEISEGDLLRLLRRDVLGLTQNDYARLVGISRRTLSDMEGDKGNVTLEVMNRAFRPLGLKVCLMPRQPALLEKVMEKEPDNTKE
ncbi:helix-turn-helix domain-containing protein [Halomonas chromatireducens]|uniref:Helix-turn-helix protein n=1 Tax=Halomonas chromatireducens TaxID=507626 RepID=A0A109UN62_9GAMM|nr:helix-turn-helix transcriptional regulator [Halomonas chromatireducens]AMD02379.1 helix-turn-helix protein [Halomonas chromatireducens]